MVEEFETWAGALADSCRELEGFGYEIIGVKYTPEPPEHYESYPYGWVVTTKRQAE